MSLHHRHPAPDAAIVPTLTYEGTTIRQQGPMLNLTDMWIAAGRPKSRRPNHWLGLPETMRFRSYGRRHWIPICGSEYVPNAGLSGIRPLDEDGIVTTTRGGGGGTWAHWQLALSYARYLSPAFHAWCNDVVRHAMQRLGAPLDLRSQPVVRYLERQFEAVFNRLETIDRHGADLMFMMASAQELLLDRRRHFSARSQAVMCEVLSSDTYEGRCPCCHDRRVLTHEGEAIPGAEFDHFFHRGLNRPEHGWLICQACHVELTKGGYLLRFSRVTEFRAFQAAVLDHLRHDARQRIATLTAPA